MAAASQALVEAVDAALPAWVAAAVYRVAGPGHDDESRRAGKQARNEVLPRLRALLETDVDEQRDTPLAILRDAVRFPTAVLRDAGVAPVERDDFERDRFPDDVYALTPTSFADFGKEVADAGVTWGATKSWVHKERHR